MRTAISPRLATSSLRRGSASAGAVDCRSTGIALLQLIDGCLAHQPLALGEGRHQLWVLQQLALFLQRGERPMHASNGALQGGIGIEHQAIAYIGQLVRVGDGGASTITSITIKWL